MFLCTSESTCKLRVSVVKKCPMRSNDLKVRILLFQCAAFKKKSVFQKSSSNFSEASPNYERFLPKKVIYIIRDPVKSAIAEFNRQSTDQLNSVSSLGPNGRQKVWKISQGQADDLSNNVEAHSVILVY